MVDLAREVAVFDVDEVSFIGNILRRVFETAQEAGAPDGADSMMFLGDFISALDECDAIEITRED